ncbi:phosphoglycerate kinase [Oricola sp.]|uniref:phosphoglycerate kinase n=1 Tax=Oricola sp. TaxID=1979950 RepID=UPI0025CD2B3A|nr:phosphoglycerate kinase [Oricola sp.]MCI5073885.1 phosphoglycerate kinase [Oricola sp.]
MLAMKARARPLEGETAIIRISLDEGISHTAIPLIDRLADAGARVVVVAGLGNPAGDINPALSLEPFRPILETLTGKAVAFVKESVGIGAEAGLARVPYGEIALMENLRFHADERRREKVFAMRLSVLGDYFIDAGDPPLNPEGWQAALKTMLPEPDLGPSETITKEEA